MEVVKICIEEVQEGNPHLFVLCEDRKYESTSLVLPVTPYALAERLEELAQKLRNL